MLEILIHIRFKIIYVNFILHVNKTNIRGGKFLRQQLHDLAVLQFTCKAIEIALYNFTSHQPNIGGY